jgi:hypothetical protein
MLRDPAPCGRGSERLNTKDTENHEKAVVFMRSGAAPLDEALSEVRPSSSELVILYVRWHLFG